MCWKDDVVYLKRADEGVGSLMLTREGWGMGVFMPAELQKMKRIALEGCEIDEDAPVEQVSRILRLCGSLEELFVVEENLDDLCGELEQEYLRSCRRERPKGEVEMLRGDEACKEGRYWGWVECDEADAMSEERLPCSLMWVVLDCAGQQQWGQRNWRLVNYKRENGGDSSGFFEEVGKGFEDQLRGLRDKIPAEEGVESWNIPRVKIVLVGTMGRMKKLFEMRQRYWKDTKEKEMKELEGGVPFAERLPYARPLSPYSLAWKDDMEAHEDTISEY